MPRTLILKRKKKKENKPIKIKRGPRTPDRKGKKLLTSK